MALDKSLVSMFISFWSCDVQREILTIALDNKTQIFGLFICLFVYFRKNTYRGLLLAIQSTFINSRSTTNARTRSETGLKWTKRIRNAWTDFTKFELFYNLCYCFLWTSKWQRELTICENWIFLWKIHEYIRNKRYKFGSSHLPVFS